ncbi:plasmid mobilization protein [Ethanoligenens harbinense]|uniref:Uncharacterized protein n=1 Tax=Ethanoligenens harbinense (strain DSM 18485 / JCM 12961 / CGMCC 1.5033 / YUAN-3) TaxID=663278 RepID=E6U8Y7_ETHHY|nr:plasmid mobilization relaxosome protein MobC [Ethanoligenens harbinense]ADU26051.1 hypothetical protein Ethha_0466 [Ethanoligenens harbinense YUAN-3]AVQ95195.1 plasmid mobilization relaxosome protein MobC [Ethanoligenens harbinense YUAN-3]AYF37885.1 plasmid mobilization relaxosome protein MobC [Ethanoligenens harbinense]AYF40609.1 plasmid mobilization relaxosome protein MobC [Ethanoligenens harbinense]QCN91442.1 plasmid mobilization relaxosome protein MobC [Ethanoligenens harbinense]
MAKERGVGIYFKVSEKERGLIGKRCEEAGIRNLSAYLRKMALNGYIIRLDITTLKDLVRLMHVTANNVNQIARRINETHSVYFEDMQDLQQGYSQVWSGVRNVLRELSKLT